MKVTEQLENAESGVWSLVHPGHMLDRTVNTLVVALRMVAVNNNNFSMDQIGISNACMCICKT